jgi:excinuclease UvrABC helicase subunit UvrB
MKKSVRINKQLSRAAKYVSKAEVLQKALYKVLSDLECEINQLHDDEADDSADILESAQIMGADSVADCEGIDTALQEIKAGIENYSKFMAS